MLTVIMNLLTFMLLASWIGAFFGLTLVFLIKVAKLVMYEIEQ